MMERFVAIISTVPQQRPIAPQTRATIAHAPGLSLLVDKEGICLAATDSPHCRQLDDGRAIILGPAFNAATCDPAQFPPDFTCAPGDAALKRLSSEIWGNFVAILQDEAGSGFHIIRAPFGSLPCFYVQRDDQLLFASDLPLFSLAGWVGNGMDWSAIARRIALRDIPASATCLAEVRELRGGFRLHVTPDGLSLKQSWNPWDHAGRDHWDDDRNKAAQRIRRAVSTATRAYGRGTDRALLMLSGGIDSSVLAASLGTQGCSHSCFNLASLGSIGDERSYARMVASHLGVPLIEAQWDAAMVDISRSQSAGMPNPLARSFMQGTSRRLREAVEASGADLTIDGGGGDNVFFSLRSVAPVTDALLRGRSLSECWSTARSIADMAQVSVATVLRRAASRAFRRSPAYRWHVEPSYLAPDILKTPALTPHHPWLELPKGAETGTAAHIALIAAAQGWAEGNDLQSPVRHVSPLASQPVVEACLKIPSWWWFRNGQNRIVARDAFRDRLPAAIVDRKAKGSPDSYIAEIFAANHHRIRSMLLDGALAHANLLDLPRLERALDGEGIVQGTDYHRIMALTDVEAWIAGQT